ncbi:hypothetical protein ACQBAU_11860 [Propionibacteriaceae bacterium Y2011]|uniref:hypothetical protein n=1 Tax=Microlunatus sp. Y2014 TaxID=3418488 RepID=UPI003B4A19F4
MPDPRRHGRRYAVRFTVAMVAYGVLLGAAFLLAGLFDGPGRYLVMALPVPALFAVVWAVFRYWEAVDELVRRDVTRSLALAFGVGSVLTFSYGLMQVAGAPVISWLWVWPVYAVCWLVASLVIRLRNR